MHVCTYIVSLLFEPMSTWHCLYDIVHFTPTKTKYERFVHNNNNERYCIQILTITIVLACVQVRERNYINSKTVIVWTIYVSTCLWCGSDPSLNLTGNVPPTKSRGSESLNESEPGGRSVGLSQPVLQHASYTSSSYITMVVLNLLWEENHSMINLYLV